MALKNCKECGREVSDKASTCPHCGVRQPTASTAHQISTVIVALAICVGIGYGVVSCAGGFAAEKTETGKLTAEQIVQFKKSAFGCVDKEKFLAAAQHYYLKEKTKFEAMFSSFDCLLIPQDVNFKVLSVVEKHGDYDIIEITNASNASQPDGLITEWDYK